MQLACEYVQTLWPKPGQEVESEFRIVRYQPLPGGEITHEFTAKGEGIPESNYFEITLDGRLISDAQYGNTFVVQSFQTKVKRTRVVNQAQATGLAARKAVARSSSAWGAAIQSIISPALLFSGLPGV